MGYQVELKPINSLRSERPQPVDAYGNPLTIEEPVITNSFGGHFDQLTIIQQEQKLILQEELRLIREDKGLERRIDRVLEDRAYLDFAKRALADVQQAVVAAHKEVPKPSWLSNEKEFKGKVNTKFAERLSLPEESPSGNFKEIVIMQMMVLD